jgi:hypothetical protein
LALGALGYWMLNGGLAPAADDQASLEPALEAPAPADGEEALSEEAAAVPASDEAVPDGPTRPVAVMYGNNGDYFRRLVGDIWVETDLAGNVRFQWVRMSGDAPPMELWDQSRDMWLLFDFDRGMIQLRVGDEPYEDQWPIAQVETEPME